LAVAREAGIHTADHRLVVVDGRGVAVIRAEAGASPVFSGGRVIRGWEVASADGATRWTVHLPDVKAGTWNFSQLFVNDQRRFRPVLPASGWHTIAGTLDPSPAAAGKGHDRFVFSGDDLRADWANLGDVEVVAVHKWTMSRLPIATIAPLVTDAAQKAVTFAGHTRGTRDWCSFPKGNRFLLSRPVYGHAQLLPARGRDAGDGGRHRPRRRAAARVSR
jgi:hypothetical protein